MLKRLVLILGVLAMTIATVFYLRLRSCENNSSPARLVVGIATWPGFAPGFAAKELGFFGDLEVDLRVIDDFSARQSAFVAGHTGLTVHTIDSFAFDLARGIGGVAVLVLDESFGADGIVVAPQIKQVHDLRGKKVAYTRGSPAHFFLVNVLSDSGLELDAVQSVQVDDPTTAAQAFISGSVEAAVTWEPHISAIVSSGKGWVLESTRTRPGLIVDILVARDEVVREQPHHLRRLVAGWLRAVAEIRNGSEHAWEVMATGLDLHPEEMKEMASGLRFADAELNRKYLAGGSPRAVDVFTSAALVWMREGLVDRALGPEDRFSAEFLPLP